MKMSGPIFFLQERIGKGGHAFGLIKFRTMLVAHDKTKGSFEPGDSSRVSPLGKFLRKAKLDELPQLFNVLKGDLSIVGPRPEVRQWTEVYTKKWAIAHSIKPGLTDNAAIEFRHEEKILALSDDPIKTYREVILPRKLDLYMDYVKNQSLWGDIKIILKTMRAIIK